MRLWLILAVLCAMFLTSRPAVAVQVSPLDDQTVSVIISSSGESRDLALQQARESAVLAAAGRVLLDDKLIRADDLMEKYLRRYASRFVLATEVLNDEFRGGRTYLESRVFVDSQRLTEDLNEKRFLYKPAYKPLFTVFLEERLEDEELNQQVARTLLVNALQAQGFKPYTGTISDPPVTSNVAKDEDLLEAAVVSAERRNIEVMFVGSAKTKLREERKLYYDQFYFYDCELTVQMMRVDTKEVLATATARSAASNRERAEAIRIAIERTAAEVAKEMDSKYKAFWPEVVQGESNFEILLTGTDAELTRIVSQQLDRLGRNTKIDVKKTFDKSAVLSVTTTATRDEVIETLRGTPYPTVTIVREPEPGKIEVQVAG